MPASREPAVSIILPTYNRARFLPEALGSIRDQAWADWELIVVDDGSTDDTRVVVEQATRDWPQPVRYIYQENQGAYGARNTGLDHAVGRYIAFYDSDDLWLPHHLADCVQALEANPDVDWVYGACRIVEADSGQELAASTFYVDGRPRPFMKLAGSTRGRLRVIDDPGAVECMIEHGLYCGLQCSVMRRRLFEHYRFEAACRNEAEDQIVVIDALLEGHRLAYLDRVHVVYRVHAENSSAAAGGGSLEKRRRLQEALLARFEELAASGRLNRRQRRALARRLAREWFWTLGYATLWMQGQRQAALACFRRGLAHWPWDWRYWKTYAAGQLRVLAGKTLGSDN